MLHIDGAHYIDFIPLREDGLQALLDDSNIAHDKNAQRNRPWFLLHRS
jgi:hypothetical protein